jgi:hypothetical protein
MGHQTHPVTITRTNLIDFAIVLAIAAKELNPGIGMERFGLLSIEH